MVRAWYMDADEGNQKALHQTDPPQFVSLDKLKDLTGIEYYQVNSDEFEKDETLQALRKERGYTYEDTIKINPEMEDYDKKVKTFFTEHIHSDEEIRLILDGSGFFDARDKNDKWIRIEVSKDDMLILPAGIYHRFTVDENDYIHANRYFVGEPVWTPINRPDAESHPSRKKYLQKVVTASPKLDRILMPEVLHD